MAFASDKGRQGAAGVSTGGYDIDNSLRFNDNDSAYLSRTPSVAGNRKTWTWSCWVKRGNLSLGSQSTIFHSYGSGNQRTELTFETDGELKFQQGTSGADGIATTTALFRDTSSWYHIMVVADFSNGTAGNRFKLYVNGSEAANTINAAFADANGQMPTANVAIEIGGRTNNRFFDGYLAEVNFVDGQALTPADFGETDEDYGHWKPIEYAGTYGTNGFYLDFSNSGSLGTDASSNTNNWTVNNLQPTDQMLDSPTNNFATLNPLDKVGAPTFSEGNLKVSVGDDIEGRSSIYVDSGKWYCEYLVSSIGNNGTLLGISVNNTTRPNYFATNNGAAYFSGNGNKYVQAAGVSYGASYAAGDIIGVALDQDSHTVNFYKNNSAQGAITIPTDSHTFSIANSGTASVVVANFGQDSSFAGNDTTTAGPYTDSGSVGDFFYEPPTDFLALCTSNLPDPAVIPSEHFNTSIYTNTTAVTGVGFAPDLVWHKSRNQTYNHYLYDIIRGTGAKGLNSNTTSVEGATDALGIVSFDSDGVTYSSDAGLSQTQAVGWFWKANGTDVLNEVGTIDSQVSANADAGFSIVSWTGTGVGGKTVGHGLSKAPDMVIIKQRGASVALYSWQVYHSSLSGNAGSLALNNTNASSTDANLFNDTAPTSSVFSLSNTAYADVTNHNGTGYIAYAFHSVEGYSKVGSYTGNGSTDGTFVHCGFRPAYVMVKVSSTTNDWIIYDSERNANNVSDVVLAANQSHAESTLASGYDIDMLSNGFKVRDTSSAVNVSSGSYIYLAFAEQPFKHTNAR